MRSETDISFDGRLRSVRVAPRQLEILKVKGSEAVPIVKLPTTQTAIWSVNWHPSKYAVAIGDASGAVTVWDLEEVDAIAKRAGLSPLFPQPTRK